MLKFLIDGYNFLFCFPDLFNDDRELFINDLNQIGLEVSSSITVIFDAYTTDSPWSREKKMGKIKVVYTQNGQSADAYIIQFLQKANAKSYHVVTEDKGLSLECQGLGAKIISPAAFLKRVQKKKKRSSSFEQKASKYEVEHYLQKFGNKKKEEVKKPFKGFKNPELERLRKIFHHLLDDEQKG